MKNNERAVVAEFHLREDGKLELFSVHTLEDGCTGTNGYNVDWCESTEEYVYHCSSSGVTLPLEIRGIYWSRTPEDVREAPCTLVDESSRKRNATRRLTELPAEFQGDGNLFDWLQENCRESDVEYCSICKSYMPTADTDEPCEHIWWCSKNATWSTPDERLDCDCEDCTPVEKMEVSR